MTKGSKWQLKCCRASGLELEPDAVSSPRSCCLVRGKRSRGYVSRTELHPGWDPINVIRAYKLARLKTQVSVDYGVPKKHPGRAIPL